MTRQQFKAIRVKAGLTQAELASILCLSGQSYVSALERGQYNLTPRVIKLMQLVEQGHLTA